ncbi:MAG: hypothetical protein KKH52_03655 [Nanoarchaeota archaeon]|nr:hypothetical protein [Nanoarchaeota archaeon]MBU1622426.1 hypothetical protein [Nanoarchaeota archaeon]MBU1974463.1 hypothetical protein [Nanoarchaeota archaeon]
MIKRSKKDKQFMIQYDQANRDALMNMSIFFMSILMSATALMVSAFSVVYVIVGLNFYTISVAIIFSIILGGFWIRFLPEAKKAIKYSKKTNLQLQKELYVLYPEYKRKFR